MTDPLIQDLGMTDTEYATLTAKGYDPNLERMIIEAGSSPEEVRNLARKRRTGKRQPTRDRSGVG
jgi:hypothetical protein